MADPKGTKARRRVNVFGVILAVILLAIASAGFTGDPWWLFGSTIRWAIAGLVAVVGIGLMLTALPGRRDHREG